MSLQTKNYFPFLPFLFLIFVYLLSTLNCWYALSHVVMYVGKRSLRTTGLYLLQGTNAHCAVLCCTVLHCTADLLLFFCIILCWLLSLQILATSVTQTPNSIISLLCQATVWSSSLYGALVGFQRFLRAQCRDWLRNVVNLMTYRYLIPQLTIE